MLVGDKVRINEGPFKGVEGFVFAFTVNSLYVSPTNGGKHIVVRERMCTKIGTLKLNLGGFVGSLADKET